MRASLLEQLKNYKEGQDPLNPRYWDTYRFVGRKGMREYSIRLTYGDTWDILQGTKPALFYWMIVVDGTITNHSESLASAINYLRNYKGFTLEVVK